MQKHPQLPSFVRRPLVGAALGVLVFLGFFGAWAVYAPLATTLTLSGMIQSSRPSLALQHPYGGLVEDVSVQVHDTVQRGQIMLRFDTSLEQMTLAAQRSIHDRLIAENNEILAVIGRNHAVETSDMSPIALRKRQVEMQGETVRQTNAGLAEQITVLQSKVRHTEDQLDLMKARAQRYASLSDQGWARRTDDEVLQEQILIVRGEIEADRASILSLENQIQNGLQRQKLAVLAFEHELSSQYQANLKRLDDLKSSMINLTDRIDRSVVRAPSSGVVASLPVETEHMVADRGATLATLAQPLKKGRVSFNVPVGFIDQVHPGMTALLIIPGLPQRDMPKIEVVLDAISPRATLDEMGNPSSYAGLAFTELDTLEQSLSGIQNGNISEDMPIQLLVSVRETTLADYIVAPFQSAFSRALQD